MEAKLKTYRVAGMAVILASVFALAAPRMGRADAVQPSTTADGTITLTQVSRLIIGSQTTLDPFTVTAPGTLTLTLSELAWPDRFAALSFSLTDARGVLGRMSSPGVMTFEVQSPGQFFAFVFGQAQGALNMGLYTLRVLYSPSVAAVPLPAALWLLLSGVAGLFSIRRRSH